MLTALMIIAAANATDYSSYERLKDNYQVYYSEQKINVRGKSVSFDGYVKSSKQVPVDYFTETVKIASETALDHIRVNYKEKCDKGGKIEIFQVSYEELNQPYKVIPYSYITLGNIWGYYDPRDSYDNIDAISYVYHNANTTHVILAHEVAHYWYERLCVYAGITTSSEEFAVQVEKLYSKKFE
jgi:hypothetical protein